MEENTSRGVGALGGDLIITSSGDEDVVLSSRDTWGVMMIKELLTFLVLLYRSIMFEHQNS